MGLSTTLASVVRPIIAALVVIAVVVLLASAIHLSGLAVLGIMLWIDVLGVIAAGLYLILRANRLIAGIGAIVCAISVWLAFFWLPDPSPFVWTLGLFIGAALIVWGTRPDTTRTGAWPLLLTRVIFGWAWIDNAQGHFRSNWLPGGGGFGQLAQGAVTRKPTFFLDPLYQSFAAGTVVPNKDLWAGLTASGELTFGLLLLVRLFGSFAAAGLLWHSLNYILVKSTVVHGAYTDKAFFAADLLSLVTAAGLVYGLDASLRPYVPAFVAQTLMGAPAGEPEAVPGRQPAPGLGRATAN